MTTTNAALESLTLTVKLGAHGVAQFQEFLSEQHRHQLRRVRRFGIGHLGLLL